MRLLARLRWKVITRGTRRRAAGGGSPAQAQGKQNSAVLYVVDLSSGGSDAGRDMPAQGRNTGAFQVDMIHVQVVRMQEWTE
jgi:hypothetical protein